MAIIKPKLSSLVSGQLPEFIREDYQTFVSFIEAYYEYLESQIITDFKEIGDIDTTLDSFVKYFKNEVALNFPATLIDDRFLLPKLKELYISKGTEASYKLLFRMLYNKEVDIKYPSNQMLRVSDGKWTQDISVFVNVVVGAPDDVVGKTIEIISSDRENLKRIKVYVDRYEPTTTAGTYELFLLSGFTGTFNIGDLINYNSIFNGVIIATTSTVEVVSPGKNFKIGQTYDIIGSGTGSVIQVISINNNGGIKIAKFINFGIGYASAFNTNILAIQNQVSTVQNYFTINGTSPSYNADILDSVDQLTDQGILSFYNYAATLGAGLYMDGTYAGSITGSFNNAPSSAVVDLNDYAVLYIQLGSFAKYQGYYKSNDGFLDDTIYIQDSKYYQAFSYAIEIDELVDSYKSIVKNLIHTAGTEIFGEYAINKYIDVSSDVSVSILNYNFNLITEDSNQLITEDSNVLVVVA